MNDTIESLSNTELEEASGGRRHWRGRPPWAGYGYGPYADWGPGPDAYGPPPCYGGRCGGPPPWAYRRAAMRGYW